EQEGRGCIAAPMAPQRKLVRPQPFGLCPVEVGVVRKARFGAGLQPCVAVRVVIAQIRDAEFTRRAMVFIGAALVAFGSLEKRQYLPIAPPVGAQPLPV